MKGRSVSDHVQTVFYSLLSVTADIFGNERTRSLGMRLSLQKSATIISTAPKLTWSPVRAWEMVTLPSLLISNRITFPLCLKRGAPATYSPFPFLSLIEETVYPGEGKEREK